MFTEASVISVPSNKILPEVGSSRRFRQRKKVDFPEPEARGSYNHHYVALFYFGVDTL